MSLEQIGQKLKAAREAKGLTFRQVYEKTKIPMVHLQAIDNGHADNLPETVYVAGFIKRYGDFVGLNGQSLADEYRQKAEPVVSATPSSWSRPVAVSAPVIVSTKQLAVADSAPPSFKTIYFNAICIVGVLGLVYYIGSTQFNNQINQQDPSLASLRETASKFNASALPVAAGSGQALAPLPAADAKITLSASQHVWVEVKSASTGESLFTGYLEQGDRRDFQDAQGLRVRAGNGGSLSVDSQGQSAVMGPPGQVAEKVYMSSTPTVAGNSEKDLKTETATLGQSTAPLKPSAKRPAKVAASREARSQGLDEGSSRRYIPGESLGGGGRSIDVPYRYTEGRLDAE